MGRTLASVMVVVCLPLLGCGASKKGQDPSTPGTGGTADITGAAGASGVAGSAAVAGDGGGAGTTADPGANVDAGDGGAPIVEAFATQALAIANDYFAWGRVDDEVRWAPYLCRLPYPGVARASQSNDAATHGQKLYSVFAKNHAAYPDGPQTDQVVVKQSWIPELVATSDVGFTPLTLPYLADAGDHFSPYAKSDGRVYKASAPAGLYIMFRLDATTPDTDEGWVYATVTTDNQVTSAGRVASCMACHETATHERLFGVPLSAFP